MLTCTFAGHRDLSPLAISRVLEPAFQHIFSQSTDFLFYTGGMGSFDDACSSCVRAAKRTLPQLNIRLILVLPYMTREIQTRRSLYEHLYDEILLPPEIRNASPCAAIPMRNRWMIDHSDLLLTYISHPYGGAFTTASYAQAQRKRILSIGPFPLRSSD